MKVVPISDLLAASQANSFRVWPPGIYDFEIIDALEKVSKNGNDMIELVLKVYDAEGKGRKIFDWLVETDSTGYKIRHFATSVGLLPQYEKGELRAADLVGRTGRCQLRIKKEKDFPDKNAVSDYLPPMGAMPKGAPLVNSIPDDEIPF